MTILTLWLGMAYAAGGDVLGWRLAGAYDHSALVSLLGERDEEGNLQAFEYLWIPNEGMQQSCGQAKAPDGLRIFEAQAVSSRLTPALFLVLEAVGDVESPELAPDNLRVAIGREVPEVPLQPFVEPRYLSIEIDHNPETVRYEQLVRTQLEVEACLEHKTGRGWAGQAEDRLRQAFLLKDHYSNDRSRKYFGGQQDPVNALLGPPDACIVAQAKSVTQIPGGRGEGRDYLIPTDIWGASLRPCGPREQHGERVDSPAPALEFTTSAGRLERTWPRWRGVKVSLDIAPGHRPEIDRVRVTMTAGQQRVINQRPLYAEPDEEGRQGLTDLLAAVPYNYPELRTKDGKHRYTVLIIPNWQLVEALKRVERDDVAATEPLKRSPKGLVNGVTYLLEHPDMLYVQINDGTDSWRNVAGVMRSSVGSPTGYTVGALAARSHLVLLGMDPPNNAQVASAHRAKDQAFIYAGFILILVIGGAGLFRLQDLWTRSPEERADYWPGVRSLVVADTNQNAPDAGEEGE